MEMEATLKAVRGKSGTESHPGPTYEVVFVTDDPDAVARLLPIIGTDVGVEFTTYQMTLPVTTTHAPTPLEAAIDASNGNGELAPRSGRRRGTAAAVVADGDDGP